MLLGPVIFAIACIFYCVSAEFESDYASDIIYSTIIHRVTLFDSESIVTKTVMVSSSSITKSIQTTITASSSSPEITSLSHSTSNRKETSQYFTQLTSTARGLRAAAVQANITSSTKSATLESTSLITKISSSISSNAESTTASSTSASSTSSSNFANQGTAKSSTSFFMIVISAFFHLLF